MASRTVEINRAPVLTLWASVVAERLGFDADEALTLGKALAGLNAQAKGVRLGIFKPAPAALRAERASRAGETKIHVALMGRAITVATTPTGWRALAKDKPIDPASVARYLESKFGDALGECRAAMTALARTFTPADLADRAYDLYVAFRPAIPEGESGWGAKGVLDLAVIARLVRSRGDG